MKGSTAISLFVINLFWTLPVLTAMTGGNFDIISDTFNVVDDSQISGGNIVSIGSVPLQDVGSQSGGSSGLEGGVEALLSTDELTLTLSASTVALGTLSASTVAIGIVTITVTTDSITGYTLSLAEDGNLRSVANDINDVSDVSVTSGSEEYGVVTSGADALLSSDTAISGSVNVATKAGRVTSQNTATTFKSAVSVSTAEGAYSHIVTFSLTANP